MFSVSMVAGVAFALTMLLVWVLQAPARRFGLVDQPGGRKQHREPTPLVGGLAIVPAFLLAAWWCRAAEVTWWLVAGLALLLLVGVVDDMRGLSGRVKLLLQVAAALLVVLGGGLSVVTLGDFGVLGSWTLGWLAVPFTLVALVGLINAINMQDGVDGLAGGTVVAMLFWLAVAGVMNGEAGSNTLALVLGAAVAGFLVFNARAPWRSNAQVFLGDAGSLALGLALGVVALQVSAGGADVPVSPMAIAWILGLPVIDTVSLMLRRILKGQDPLMADREHLHHLLMRAGHSAGEASWILVAIVFAVGGMGVLLSLAGVSDGWLLLGLLVLAVLHFVFIRHAWKTLKALRRLVRTLDAVGPTASLVGLSQAQVFAAPVGGWRRNLALLGLYGLMLTVPQSSSLALASLGVVGFATLLAAPAWIRDMVRLPVFWIAVVLTLWVVGTGFVAGRPPFEDATGLLSPGWLWVLVSGLGGLVLGWWLAGARLHWPWLLWALLGSMAVAVVFRATGLEGDLDYAIHGAGYGLPEQYVSVASVTLVLMLAVALRALGRLHCGWRPAFSLGVSVVTGLLLGALVIVAGHAVHWVVVLVGGLVVTGAVFAWNPGARRWAGVLTLALLLAGSVLSIHSLPVGQGPEVVTGVSEQVAEPSGAGARVSGWKTGVDRALERPWLGWSEVSGLQAGGGYHSLMINLWVGSGAVGLALLLVFLLALAWGTVRARARGVVSPSLAVGTLGVIAALVMLFALANPLRDEVSYLFSLLVVGFMAAVAVLVQWQSSIARGDRAMVRRRLAGER